MHLKWINEKLAKAVIYALSCVALAVFVLFANHALAYNAMAQSAQPPGGEEALANAPALPPAENPAALPGRLSTSSAAPARPQSTWRPGVASEDFPLLPGVTTPEPNPDYLSEERQRIRAMDVGFPNLSTTAYAGEFHNTAYCCEVYPHICGGNGITASGTIPTPGLTCAADWEVFPPGTWLYIEDVGIRRVEDSGSAIIGKCLDIAVDTHRNALAWGGFGTHSVWVLAWPEA